MKKVLAILALAVLLAAPLTALAEAEEENEIYQLLDENGEPVNEKCPVHYIKYINKSELLQKNSKPEWKLAYD